MEQESATFPRLFYPTFIHLLMRPLRQWLPVVLAFFMLSEAAWAQTASVRGFVTDASDGEALQEVNIVLEDAIGQVRGTATDAEGSYVIARIEPGRYLLRASFVGYVPYADTLVLAANQTLDLDISLEPSEEALDEVVVEAGDDGGVARLRGGLQTIRPRDIQRIPTPGVSGDLATYLTTLPGVITVGDQGGRIFIRGGEPTHNLVLLDGMLVYQPFHILGFYSAFPTEILRQVDIYAGGYGARYGGRLSSVIDVTSRNGNNRQTEGFVTVSPFIVGGLIEGPIRKERISFLASARQSVVEDAAAVYVGTEIPYRFNDLFGKVHAVISRNTRLSVSALHTTDRGTVGIEDVDETGELQPLPVDQVRWSNTAVGARYLMLPSTYPILAEVIIAYSRIDNAFGGEDDPMRTASTGRISTEVNVTQYGRWLDTKWGAFTRTLGFRSDLAGLFQPLEVREEYVTEAGLYVEPVLRIGEHWEIEPSLRLHGFPSKNVAFIEPRLRAVWQRKPHQVSGALGLYHQEVVGINDRRDATSVFTAWAATPTGKVPRATHAILGYARTLAPGLDVSLEGYYKDLSNLFIAEWTAYPRLTTRLQQADGRAAGLDARLEWRRPRFYGYVGYGLSTVRYSAKQPQLPLWYGTPSLDFRPAHDRRHQLNLVANRFWGGFDLSARWQLGSGLPFSRALGFDGFVLMDGPVDVFEERGDRRVVFERPFNGVLPAYHRLDLAASRTFDWSGGAVKASFTLLNVYNRANIFYLDVFTLRRVDQLPLLPSFGLEVRYD